MNIKFQKIIALFLAAALSVSALAACNSETAEKKKKKKKSNKNTATSSEAGEDYSSGELSTGDFLEEEEEWEDEWKEEEEVDETPADAIEEPSQELEDAVFSQITIHNQTPTQTDFLGFNAVYNAFAFRTDDQYGRNYTPKMAAEEVRRAAQAGIHIARSTYNVDMAYNAKTGTYNYESEAMTGLYRFCQELEKYDIDLYLVNQGSNDAFFENYHWVAGGTWKDTIRPKENTPHQAFKVEGDPQATLNKFAEWMVGTVKALRAHGCYNACYLSTQCEPGLYWNTALNDPENSKYADQLLEARSTQSANLNNAVHRALVKAGLRNYVKLQGPNINTNNVLESSEDACLRYLEKYERKLDKGANDLYSWHSYQGAKLDMDNYGDWDTYYSVFSDKVDMNKYVNDEWNFDAGQGYGMNFRLQQLDGCQIATNFVAMLNHGVRTGYLWALFDQLWVSNFSNNGEFEDGIQKIGLAPTLLESNIVFPAYYSQSLVGTLVGRNHCTAYRGDDEDTNSVYAAMTEGKDGSKNVLVVNMNADTAYVSLDFEKTIGGQNMYRHVYNGPTVVGTSNTDLIGFDLKKTNVTTKLKDVIPGFSVVVYTTDKVEGSIVK